MRSLEDNTMNADPFGDERRWELVKNYADHATTIPSGMTETKVRMSTQPESLILAQSERWRQA